MVAQQRFKHLLTGIVGGGCCVPAAVLPVVPVNNIVCGKGVAGAELRRGLRPQHAVVALVAIQSAVQVVVILAGILQNRVIDICPGDLQPCLDIAVQRLVIADIGRAGITGINTRLKIAAGSGGGKRPSAAAQFTAACGQLGAVLGGGIGGLGVLLCLRRGLCRSSRFLRRLFQRSFRLLRGGTHIGGQVCFGSGTALPCCLFHALPLLGLAGFRRCQCIGKGGFGTGGHNTVYPHANDCTNHNRCNCSSHSSAAIFFSQTGFFLFGAFCHNGLLFSGLLPCSGISAGVWCQYSILFPLCKGLSCIGCISHSLCPPQSSGRSPRRPAGGFCGQSPQRRLRRRGCAPHFRSPVLYPGQKSTCLTADALFLSIFRFLSIPPSACRSCLPQSFSRYPPASPAAAPSDRGKTPPYPSRRYGSAHTPPAPTSPAAIHCAE